jgi:hypothetical protein
MEGDNYVNYNDNALNDGYVHIFSLCPYRNCIVLASPGILVKRIFDIYPFTSLLFVCGKAMTPVRAIS